MRKAVPLLALLALGLLFFKLNCPLCAPSSIPMAAAGYFALLLAVSLLYPAWPSTWLGRIGLIWSILLAFSLTAWQAPFWCVPCLLAHGCHAAIWLVWAIWGQAYAPQPSLLLLFLAPLGVVSLFHPQLVGGPVLSHLKVGDVAPAFGEEGPVLVHFVAPDCPYCRQQIQALQASPIRTIHISPSLPADFVALAPQADWLLDVGGQWRARFNVKGFPTLFAIQSGKIDKIRLGAIAKVEEFLKKEIVHDPQTRLGPLPALLEKEKSEDG